VPGITRYFVLEVTLGHKYLIANGVLWAAAIISAAIVGAPTVLSAVLLPALAAMSLLLAWRAPRTGAGNL
jgi:hypothetical protein